MLNQLKFWMGLGEGVRYLPARHELEDVRAMRTAPVPRAAHSFDKSKQLAASSRNAGHGVRLTRRLSRTRSCAPRSFSSLRILFGEAQPRVSAAAFRSGAPRRLGDEVTHQQVECPCAASFEEFTVAVVSGRGHPGYRSASNMP